MYQKIKHFVFTLIYLLLWVRFTVAIFDPLTGGFALNVGIPIYTSWRTVFDWIYYLSGWLMWPVKMLWDYALNPILPDVSWFPGMYTSTFMTWVIQVGQSNPTIQGLATNPFARQSFVGYIELMIIPVTIFYSLLNPLVDRAYDFLKNLVWNVLIEFSFTKKKEAKYQDALEKRAADLMKLNVEYKNLSKEASVLAASVITDELTKVYNKRFFLEKMAYEFLRAQEQKSPLSIAMVDIDHFKRLNDTYGHLLGDKVLQAVAQVAKRFTPADCFCCRFGGEEFAIIMPGKKPEEVTEIIATIHRSLPLLRFAEDPNMRTSASFGIAIAHFRNAEAQQIESFETFIKMADDELYRAKLNGRNRYETNRTLYDGVQNL